MKSAKKCVGETSKGKQLRLLSHFKKLPSDGSFQIVTGGSTRSLGSDIEVLDGTFSDLRPINATRKGFKPKHHSTPAYPAPTYEDISEAESEVDSLDGSPSSPDKGPPETPGESPSRTPVESPARSPLNMEVNGDCTLDTINDTQEDEENMDMQQNMHVAEIDNFLSTFMKRKLDRKAELGDSLKKHRRKIRRMEREMADMEREMVDLDAAIQKGRAVLER